MKSSARCGNDCPRCSRASGWGKRVGFSQDSVVSQAAVVLDEKKQQGLITSFEPPVAYVQKEDPSVCVVELEFDLAAVFSRIYLTAHISI